MSSPHDGHRSRMKQRFLEHGLDNFDDHSVLELLLFYAIPRRDVNGVAHALLERFGSLDQVFDMAPEELMQVEGVGESAALLLKLCVAVGRRYFLARNAQQSQVLDNADAAGAYLLPRYLGERDEVVYLVCLDDRRQVLACRELSRGVVNSAQISLRKITELALRHNASGVILSHNHVAGVAAPSREDVATTRRVRDTLNALGVELCDHIIVGGGEFISLAESGML